MLTNQQSVLACCACRVHPSSSIHTQVVRNTAACLRPGSGRLLLRDYADADLAHDRLAAPGRRQRLAANCFVRGDGTLCSYFTQVKPPALTPAMAGCDSPGCAASPSTGNVNRVTATFVTQQQHRRAQPVFHRHELPSLDLVVLAITGREGPYQMTTTLPQADADPGNISQKH